MPLSSDDIVLIDRFIDGELTENESSAFDERQNDPNFRAELEIRSGVSQAIHDLAEKELRAELKAELKKVDFTEPSSRDYRLYYWAAASLAIILMVLWLIPGKQTSESLFRAYYEPYPATINTRSELTAEASPFEAYNNGRYEEAAALIRSAVQSSDVPASRTHLNLLLGNCYLNTNSLGLAEETFETLRENDDSMATDHAEWFLALTYLKQGRADDCRKLLEEIVVTNSQYSDKAENLLNAMK